MSEKSANLSMPFLLPAQAQKHLTHNDALEILDAIVQLAVEERSLLDPPYSPQEGDRHIVAVGASGDWDGHAGEIAVLQSGAWVFHSPAAGWRAFVKDEECFLTYRGGEWRDDDDLKVLAGMLGINTSPDAVNRLAVASEATLFTHNGSGHQLKLNKAGAGDTVSVLFQSNWQGHAEMGLSGSSDFAIKTSPDGSAWTVALQLDSENGHASGAAVQGDALDSTGGRLMKTGAFGLGDLATGAVAPGDDADLCLAAGFYSFSASGVNCPVLDPSGGSLIVMRGGTSTARQLFVSEEGARIWSRGYANASWQPWVEMMTQASMIGMVSEASGTPTGAVIESGSNGDGEYVRWADGTQICTNSNAPISSDPAPFSGTVTSIDGGKLRIGRWF